MKPGIVGVGIAVGAPVVLLVALLGIAILGGSSASAACTTPAPQPSASSTSTTAPEALTSLEDLASDPAVRAEQIANATAIMRAAADLGLSVRAQQIGIMTALGESSLRVLDRGDAAGPDSRGLFQQRDNGAWGTYADRMDPYISATNFFMALAKVDGWEALEPTIAAHRVQANADPYYYEKFWAPAQRIVTDLAGVASTCGANSSGPVSPDGWTKPLTVTATISSTFGLRYHPIEHVWKLHAGTDLAAPCKTPIYAAASGTVIAAGGSGASTQRDLVMVDVGGGITTSYMHEYPDGIHVAVGQVVTAGDYIAEIGSAGLSTGCHLHFEIRQNGTAIDAEPFMAARGVPLP